MRTRAARVVPDISSVPLTSANCTTRRTGRARPRSCTVAACRNDRGAGDQAAVPCAVFIGSGSASVHSGGGGRGFSVDDHSLPFSAKRRDVAPASRTIAVHVTDSRAAAVGAAYVNEIPPDWLSIEVVGRASDPSYYDFTWLLRGATDRYWRRDGWRRRHDALLRPGRLHWQPRPSLGRIRAGLPVESWRRIRAYGSMVTR